MKKILVADDNAEILKVMELILRSNNYNVVLENDGKQVINAVHDCRPDLIILDVSFGPVSGIEICKTIKLTESIKLIPVIMFSANIQNMKTTKGCGDDFIFKGFSIDEMLEKIELLINKAALNFL